MSYIISKHALEQIVLRGIPEDVVIKILDSPGQIINLNDKRIYQSIIEDDGKQYLIRIFVNHFKEPNVVITAYKTSKINKYYEGNI
ncbi:DUF4258 domain-containing protein [uncultured Mucilaginibacter sp.]|uniref:DUF4258 domain-containing protein n=1 Tax=uncultured Mucilaginibacter sp. TaxID=797541 RepID=UPI003449CE3D